MSEIDRFDGASLDVVVNSMTSLKDGIWCVRTIKNGKHASLLAENIEDYPEAFNEAQLLPLRNAITNSVHKYMTSDGNRDITERGIVDAVLKAIREKLVYVDTQKMKGAK